MCVWLCHVRGCGVVHILLTSSPPLKCSHPCSTTSSPSSSRKHENLPLPCSTGIWEKGVSWRGREKEGERGKKESQMINGSTFYIIHVHPSSSPCQKLTVLPQHGAVYAPHPFISTKHDALTWQVTLRGNHNTANTTTGVASLMLN